MDTHVAGEARMTGNAKSSLPLETAIELEIRRPGLPETPIVTVIIPLAPGDTAPVRLLGLLPASFEVILARGGTRASSMNRAAASASGNHLWFIHADTVLSTDAIAALQAQLKEGEAIRYFDLRFDGGLLMRLTELGVFLRCRWFGIPFGDQALCLPRDTFTRLGGYDERMPLGEDHFLIRKAHRLGIPVRPVGATILTSARKYARDGWFRTTWQHLCLTFRQAFLHR